MPNDNAQAFASYKGRAVVVAAAGCGKTELIARAVLCDPDGRHLILTHTHAGVRALRDRLRKYNVPPRSFWLDTIAGWTLRYAVAFPTLAQLTLDGLSKIPWPAVYDGATRVVSKRAVQEIIRDSYSGMYVDEYQDCSKRQHHLIMRLAELLPCRIVGDPLQGIYDFDPNEPIIDWQTDVSSNFTPLPELTEPHRWKGASAPLGQWLKGVRNHLQAGRPPDLTALPSACTWIQLTDSPAVDCQAQLLACRRLARSHDTITAIAQWPQTCHAFAKRLNGSFTCVETAECEELLDFTARIERTSGRERALAVLDFAETCMTQGSTATSIVRPWIDQDLHPPKRRNQKFQQLDQAMQDLMRCNDYRTTSIALRVLKENAKGSIHRRELWNDMQRVLEQHDHREGTLTDTARRLRDIDRHAGRHIPRCAVARTLLIKGLEFDHVVVLNADELGNEKNLYVALTRGTRSLTIFSHKPQIDPWKRPKRQSPPETQGYLFASGMKPERS